MTLRRSLIAVVAAGSLVALAGCTDSPAPPTSSTSSASSASPSTSATTSASPSSSATTGIEGINIPAAAKQKTYAGAQAMAKFYLLETDKGYVTNDPKVVQSLAASTCVGCNNAIVTYADRKKQNQHQLSTTVKVVDFAPAPPAERDDQAVVDVLCDIGAAEVVDGSGAKVQSFPASKLTVRVRLTWTGEFWRIDAVGAAPA